MSVHVGRGQALGDHAAPAGGRAAARSPRPSRRRSRTRRPSRPRRPPRRSSCRWRARPRRARATVPEPSGRVAAFSLSSANRSSKVFTVPGVLVRRCACAAAAVARSAAICARRVSARKTAEPATKVSAPASAADHDRLLGDAAVDLQPDVEPARRRPPSRSARSFGIVSGMKRLAAEARLDGHHEHLVELVEQVEVRLDGGAGLERDARARADRPQTRGRARPGRRPPRRGR